jgi:hypothetical protein
MREVGDSVRVKLAKDLDPNRAVVQATVTRVNDAGFAKTVRIDKGQHQYWSGAELALPEQCRLVREEN